MTYDVLRGKLPQKLAAEAKIFLAQSQLLQDPLDRQVEFLHEGVGLDDVAAGS